MTHIPKLPADGERLITEYRGQIVHEHLHRYSVARQYTTGKDVLDIACGEGYGSNLLSKGSKSVTGVDIAENAIAHARAKYRHKNLKFVVGSCTSIPLPSRSIDVALTFETIEHITEHEIFIKELKRVLRPDGLLIISSPDKRNYSDVPNHQNPFHLRELYHEEFKELIRDNFKETTFAKQEYNPGSIIELECATPISHIGGDYTKTDYKSLQDLATYSIAFASDISLPRIQSSVFKSYNEQNEQDLFNTQLFISSSPEFNEKDSVRVTSWLGKRTLIEFVNIEKHIDHGPIHLRIDPSDTAGVLEIHEIKILTIANDGEIHSIISPRAKQLNNLHPISGNPSMYFSSNTDSNFILEPIEWDGISKISLNFDVTLHHDLSSLANYIDQKEAELEQHGTFITELQAELSERDDAIHKAEATLEQRDATIIELKDSVEQRDSSITELHTELSERDDAIHKAEATLVQRNATIVELKDSVEQRDSSITELHTELSERDDAIHKAEATLVQRNATIVELKDSVEQRDSSITELHTELSERDDAIHKAEATLVQRNATIVELKDSVEQRDSSITELHTELSERDDAIHKAEATLVQRNATIVELKDSVEQRDSSITELHTELSERDDAIHKAEATLVQRNATIVELKDSVEQRDSSITELHTELSERDDAIHKAEATLVQRNATIVELKDSVEQRDSSITKLQAKIKELNDKIVRMQNSFSWKATSIFRTMRRFILDTRMTKKIKIGDAGHTQRKKR